MDKSEKTLENIGYLRLLYKTVIYKPGTDIDENDNQNETYICTNFDTNFNESRDTWEMQVGDCIRVYNENLEVIESYEATEETQYVLDILYDDTLDDNIDLRNRSILALIRIGNEYPQSCMGITDFSGHMYTDIGTLCNDEGIPLISYLHPGWHNMLQVSSSIEDKETTKHDEDIDGFSFGESHQHCRIVQLNPDNRLTVYYDNIVDDSSVLGITEFSGHTIVNKIGKSSLTWKSTFRLIGTYLIWVDKDHTLMDIIQFDGHYKKYIGHCSICMNYSYNGDKSGNISSIYDVITIINPIALSVDESIRPNYKNRAGYIDYARSLFRFNNSEVISTTGSGIQNIGYLSGVLLLHYYGQQTKLYNDDHDLIKINLRDNDDNSAELKNIVDDISMHNTYKIGDVLFSLSNSSLVVLKVSKRVKSKYITDAEVISELNVLYYYRYVDNGYRNQTVRYEEASDKSRVYYVMLNKTNKYKCKEEQIKQIIIDPSSESEEGIVKVRDVNVVRDKSSTNSKMINLKPVADLESKVGQIESVNSNSKMLRLACRYLYGPSVFISCYI